ncbi:MAG: hypothetical protein K2R98_26870 [Gemmataceae bacterium]|nr:hypothetical protein [Gemmataceae bacterium]
MAAFIDFLQELKQSDSAAGNFIGVLNVLIGRRIQKPDGTVISTGVTWRELSHLLKKVRWDREAVRELGMNPASLPPRDRQRYWYVAISNAHVDSEQATLAGDRLAEALQQTGYNISASPQTAVEK